MSDIQTERFELPEPGPMIPPTPAVVMGVKGDDETRDDLTIVWSFVLNGNPPQVGVSVHEKSAISGEYQVALELLKRHGEFTLNVPHASWVREFDDIDMCASEKDDKFARAGLHRVESKTIAAPGIAEAPVILECKVLDSHFLPPARTVFFAEVLRTTTLPGVTDQAGRLNVEDTRFFGMTAGSGEFYTMGEKLGYIGMTRGPSKIRY